ncbi:transposase, partial [Desemzia sp. FAM 23989]|uniref:transposase n=1 Tax=Desemzia sp. FAM 23989 TaxID=3259523 RepID=UPI0038879F91
RTLCFTNETKGYQVSTIRLFLFKIAGKIVHSGRRQYLKLSSYHVYQKLFYRILQKHSGTAVLVAFIAPFKKIR